MQGISIQLRASGDEVVDGLGASFIGSFKELTQTFGSRFIMGSRVPQPLDSLLSMSMREGKTLKCTLTNTRKCLMRLMRILMTWL